MREVITYVAYDGIEFNNYDACLEYELKAWKFIKEFERIYSFYDKNRDFIFPPTNNSIEDWLEWIEESFDNCYYVARRENLPKEIDSFIFTCIGFGLRNKDFNNQIGLFEYDWNNEKWIKV